jgi:hypothetical protein
MNELGPNAKDLVEAGRTAFKPNEADRARVLQILLPKLGASLAPGAVLATKSFGQGTLAKLSLALVGAGVISGGLMISVPEDNQPSAVATAVVMDATAPATDSPPPDVPSVTPSSETKPAVAEAPVTRTRAEDRLADEVEILSRAGASLRSGQPNAALKALNEHQRRFPSGVLSQERSAARVQALCALGRKSEGVRELQRLERKAPGSPHVARARKACAVDER